MCRPRRPHWIGFLWADRHQSDETQCHGRLALAADKDSPARRYAGQYLLRIPFVREFFVLTIRNALVIALQLGQYRLGAADVELAGRFYRHMLDDTVINNHGVAIGTDTHATCGQIERQIHRL